MGFFDGPSKAVDRYAAVVDAAPSWDALRELSGGAGGGRFRQHWDEAERGLGPANHQASLRLFDLPEGTEPRVELFRDTAGWCPYCQKVWMLLEAKRIPYRVTKVPMSCYGDKPASFRALSPGGGIPVARIDGRVLTESNDIMYALERIFTEHPMLPAEGTPESAKVQTLLDLERSLFSAWFGWLRTGQDEAARFVSVMDRTNHALQSSGGPFFLGAPLSMVDIFFIPFVERMAASLPYYKGLRVRGNPRWQALDRWFVALETQTEWYAGIKSDAYTHVTALPPQIGGCVQSGADARRMAGQIDGTDGTSWMLPLPPAGLDALEPISPAVSDADARLEAAERLMRNGLKVARFAARAVGTPGQRFGAPLADPRATPDENAVPVVDAALRHVVHALVAGPDAAAAPRSSLPAMEVAKSLAYLRDRVSVPRDMSFAAARQLRAHLNAYSAELTGGKLLY